MYLFYLVRVIDVNLDNSIPKLILLLELFLWRKKLLSRLKYVPPFDFLPHPSFSCSHLLGCKKTNLIIINTLMESFLKLFLVILMVNFNLSVHYTKNYFSENFMRILYG